MSAEEGFSAVAMKLKSEALTAFFEEEKIEHYGVISSDKLTVIQPRKLESIGFEPRSAIILCAPYLYRDQGSANLSMYARSKDYHIFFRDLFERMSICLETEYPGYHFRGFADSSPYDERTAAVSAGIGYIGDHGLVICEPYGSYVFIGIMLSDLPSASLTDELPQKSEKECLHCAACKHICPSKDICLSSLTQKKGELTETESALILRGKYAWGCDACQDCCPLNRDAAETPIDFFAQDRIVYLDRTALEKMSDEAFASRAFSWRKRVTIMRNIELFEKLNRHQ